MLTSWSHRWCLRSQILVPLFIHTTSRPREERPFIIRTGSCSSAATAPAVPNASNHVPPISKSPSSQAPQKQQQRRLSQRLRRRRTSAVCSEISSVSQVPERGSICEAADSSRLNTLFFHSRHLMSPLEENIYFSVLPRRLASQQQT